MRPEQLANVSFKDVQRAAMETLHGLQRFSPQVIVTGTAWIFLAVCERYGVDPRRGLEVAERVRRFALDNHPTVPRAIARYAREELPS